MGQTVAILTRGDLFPTNHGAAVKIVKTAEALVRQGHRVVLLSDNREGYLRLGAHGTEQVTFSARARAMSEWPILRNQRLFDRLLAQIGYPSDEFFLYRPVVDPAWWARVLYVGLKERIDVYQAEFPGYAVPAIVATALLGGRSVLVQHNVEHDRLSQMAGLSPRKLRQIRLIEEAIVRAVNDVIVVSEDDRARLPRRRGVWLVPHGVETRGFNASRLDLRARYGLRGGPVLFFHGTLHYAPNAEAVRFIADELLPRLPEDVSVLCAGMSPPLALASHRLKFAGPVDNLAAHIASADLCICPLFAGGGTRMKLMEYFAAGKAVVSTPLGAEGLPVRHETHLLLAQAPAFANTVLRALESPTLRKSLGNNARSWASAYDWRDVATAYSDIHHGRGHDFVPRPNIEAHLPPRTVSKPLTMLLLVNRGCNLRCSFCDLWDNHQHMPLHRALALLDQAAKIGTRVVVLTGGEPLLHPHLFDIVRHARRLDLSVNITTNGTLVERHFAELVDAGVSSLSFSIDGLATTHDRLRGQPGAHDRTWRALLRTIHDGRIDTAVYFTVTNQNVKELVAVHDAAQSAGARFDFWPVNDAPDLYLRTDAEKASWLAAIRELSVRDGEVAAKAHYYAEALAYHAGERGSVRCLGLVDQFGVTYSGDLLPCCVWGGEGLKVGNVFEQPLDVLWHTPEVQQARKHLWNSGCSAGCYNHSLYELVASTGESHRIPARLPD